MNLEKDCEICKGTCHIERCDYNSKPRKMYCNECNGTGKVPSEEGEKLIKFLQKYLILTVK